MRVESRFPEPRKKRCRTKSAGERIEKAFAMPRPIHNKNCLGISATARRSFRFCERKGRGRATQSEIASEKRLRQEAIIGSVLKVKPTIIVLLVYTETFRLRAVKQKSYTNSPVQRVRAS